VTVRRVRQIHLHMAVQKPPVLVRSADGSEEPHHTMLGLQPVHAGELYVIQHSQSASTCMSCWFVCACQVTRRIQDAHQRGIAAGGVQRVAGGGDAARQRPLVRGVQAAEVLEGVGAPAVDELRVLLRACRCSRASSQHYSSRSGTAGRCHCDAAGVLCRPRPACARVRTVMSKAMPVFSEPQCSPTPGAPHMLAPACEQRAPCSRQRMSWCSLPCRTHNVDAVSLAR
jgi:hypothetical protein